MIEIESKKGFSENDFLRLLLASLVKQNVFIISNHDLEKKIYRFYINQEFKLLFEDVCAKKTIEKINDHVDLSVAFQAAYSFGLLILISDSYSDLRSIINIPPDMSDEIIAQYDKVYVNAMALLATKVHNINETIIEDNTVPKLILKK
jgi:hypothetical protein